MKLKAYVTLVYSEMHAETKDQLVSLPWRAVVLRLFEEEMRTTTKLHALIAISNDPRRSGRSVREAERRSLFHSIHVSTNIGTSVKMRTKC